MSDIDAQEVVNNSELPSSIKQTYTCEICSKTLESRGMHTLHMAKHLRPHRCDICGRGFAKRFTLSSHRKTHSGQKDYHCDLCGQGFTLKSQLSKHNVASHPPDGQECIECGAHFKNSKLLLQHQVYHCRRGVVNVNSDFPEGHVCSNCGKLFNTALELRSHMRYHSHQYQCTHCDKKFGERSLLRSHLLSAHFDVRPYRCLVCANSFAMKAHCQRHCRMHLRHQNFMCDGCELMFRFELDLMSHKNKGLCKGKSSNALDARKLILYDKPDLEKLGITNSMLGYPSPANYVHPVAVSLPPGDKDRTEAFSHDADSASDSLMTKNSKYSCSMCDHRAKKAAMLTFHMAQVHGVGIEPFRCCICNRGYAFENNMRSHIESHIPHKVYRCETCDTRFTRRRGLEKHKCRLIPGVESSSVNVFSRVGESALKKGDDENNASCDMNNAHSIKANFGSSSMEFNGSIGCHFDVKPSASDNMSCVTSAGESSSSLSALGDSRVDHQAMPSDQYMLGTQSSVVEEECDVKDIVADAGQLDQKVLSMPITVSVLSDADNDDRRVMVNGVPLSTWCDMAVNASRTKAASSTTPQFEGWCSVCQIMINSRYKYNVHMQRHSDTRSFACTDCSKTFKTSDNLRAHRRWHDPSRLITCTVCGAQSASASDMRKHQSVHEETKPFECSMCGKRFRRQIYLSIHERTHTGETPYECEVCGRQFRIQSSLHDHLKVHTGDKPFTCQVCGKRFSQRGNWRAHERRHHGGVRAFSCERCSKSFVQNYELQNHRMRCVVDNFPYTCLLCGMRFIREHPLRRHINRHGCGVCGQQFVVMKEKISHQLRCRRNAKTEQPCV